MARRGEIGDLHGDLTYVQGLCERPYCRHTYSGIEMPSRWTKMIKKPRVSPRHAKWLGAAQQPAHGPEQG